MPIIVVEGADAVGKSTQVSLLAKELEGIAGCELRQLHLPRLGDSTMSGLLGDFLGGKLGALHGVDARVVALLYAADRRDALKELLWGEEAGHILLLDRYVDSNIAYQCAKLRTRAEQEGLARWIERLEYECMGLPEAAVTVFIDAPLSFSVEQLASRRHVGLGDIHEEDIEFQKSVRSIYRMIYEGRPEVVIPQCAEGEGMRPVEEIAREVWADVEARLRAMGYL